MNVSGLAQTCLLSSDPSRARRQLRALLAEAAWPGDCDAVVLAVHEAIMNSHRHAGGTTYAAAHTDGSTVVVEVHDGGPGFDLESHCSQAPDPGAERGRGLWLIGQIADRWSLDCQPGITRLSLLFLS